MALLYRAQLSPSKPELILGWIGSQPWFGDDDPSTAEVIGAYRFDDPDGQVGVETHLVRTAAGQMFQVPVTYRDAPLDGAEEFLIRTLDHSVLGTRWAYDGVGDPVYAATLAATILTGGTQADMEVAVDESASSTERRELTTFARGSGSPDTEVPVLGPLNVSAEGTSTVIRAGDLELVVLRALDPATEPDGPTILTGTWPGQDTPALLAVVRTS